jgi:hypothetical protein
VERLIRLQRRVVLKRHAQHKRQDLQQHFLDKERGLFAAFGNGVFETKFGLKRVHARACASVLVPDE